LTSPHAAPIHLPCTMRVVVRDFEKFPAVQHHDDVAEVAKATCAQCTRKSRHRNQK